MLYKYISFVFYLPFLTDLGRSMGLPQTIPFNSTHMLFPFNLISLWVQKVLEYSSFMATRHGPELEEVESGERA